MAAPMRADGPRSFPPRGVVALRHLAPSQIQVSPRGRAPSQQSHCGLILGIEPPNNTTRPVMGSWAMAASSRPGAGPGADRERLTQLPPPMSSRAEPLTLRLRAWAVMVSVPGVREATMLMVQVRAPVLVRQWSGPGAAKVDWPVVEKHPRSPSKSPALYTVAVASDFEVPSAGSDTGSTLSKMPRSDSPVVADPTSKWAVIVS